MLAKIFERSNTASVSTSRVSAYKFWVLPLSKLRISRIHSGWHALRQFKKKEKKETYYDSFV